MAEGTLPKGAKNLSTYLRFSQRNFYCFLERISVHPMVGNIQCGSYSSGNYWTDNAAYNSSSHHIYYYLLCVFKS